MISSDFWIVSGCFLKEFTLSVLEVSTENSKVMTNSPNTISADISLNGKQLEVSST